jgi:hypothetical protein
MRKSTRRKRSPLQGRALIAGSPLGAETVIWSPVPAEAAP